MSSISDLTARDAAIEAMAGRMFDVIVFEPGMRRSIAKACAAIAHEAAEKAAAEILRIVQSEIDALLDVTIHGTKEYCNGYRDALVMLQANLPYPPTQPAQGAA